MRLLYHDGSELRLTKDLSSEIPSYAILSHRWGHDEDEIKFRELDSPDKSKVGYKKLQLCGEQARRDGLTYFWVDTCCIDKSSSAELDKNVNSMFYYYQESTKCYVYLPDVDSDQDFEKSDWFTRGWTLQELLAPRSVEFYSRNWEYLGNKDNLAHRIYNITHIPLKAFHGELSQFTKDERLRWIQNRRTTEKEDEAYCLLGIFNVSMSLHYGEGKTRAFTRLENKIRKSLKPTLQTIDNSIRDYYLGADRLSIERLSGRCLPMGSCFINLSIIDTTKNDKINVGPAADALTLTTSLGVETPEHSEQITLETLFDHPKLVRGRKRILIWGRAGIGKTTLCKKMVYDFYYGDLWQDLYDRVFWLPLRRLKWLRDEVKSVAEMVEKVCFHSARDGLFPPEQLHDMLSSHCLFILDGLDEVSSAFDPDSSMGANLNKLLSQENVVITSRPHNTTILNRMPPDLKLETIGFFPEQVEEYLDKETDLSQSQVSQIHAFIEGHPIIQNLIRIPIQLDAICYSWGMAHFQQDDTTMTALYQATSDCLWKKDIIRFDMKCYGEPITPQQVQFCTDVRSLIEREASCLEKLAFAGLYHQLFEFNLTNINTMAGCPDPWFIDRVCKSSFLRSSDNMLMPYQQTHHFIHLTFQEFFAARYFVRYLLSSEPIKFPRMTAKSAYASKSMEIEPVAFIEREKYNVRFNIFWRFVAGLLSQTEERHLLSFFEKLESEPIDLLGVLHQRLIAHCLNEVDTTQVYSRAKVQRLEQSYGEWTQFESRLCNTEKLLQEAECPTRVLGYWLEGTDMERTSLMTALMKKPNVSPDMLVALMEQAERDVDGTLRDHASAVIAVHCDQLTEDYFLSTFTGRDKRRWLEATERVSMPHRIRSRTFVENAVSLLQDEDYGSRCLALRTLCHLSRLPKSITEVLMQLLQDQDSGIRAQAAKALGQQRSLPESVVTSLILLLQDQDFAVRARATEAIRGQRSLSKSTVTTIAQMLHDKVSSTRRCIEALGGQRSLSDSMVTTLTQMLHDKHPSTRRCVIEALRGQRSLPESTIISLILLLQDRDCGIRARAAEALGGQESLHMSVITVLVELLRDQEPDVRGRVALTLGRQRSLPESVVTSLVPLLQDQDSGVQARAAEAIRGHRGLSESIVNTLTRMLQDKNSNVRGQAALTLGVQKIIPESVITSLIQLLQDRDASVQFRATSALQGLPLLSELHCKSIALLLESKQTSRQAFNVLESKADMGQLLLTLNAGSLENLVRKWLRASLMYRSHYLVTLHNNTLVVETGGNRSTVAVSSEQQRIFKEKWLQVQRVLGAPLHHKDNGNGGGGDDDGEEITVLGKRKREEIE